jgi:hypothetical protein
MSDFPTLSRGVSVQGYAESRVNDPTLRTLPEDGKVMTRGRMTVAKKRFEFVVEKLSDADKALLETFEEVTVNVGAETFNWTRHKQGVETVFVVRLAQPIEYTLDEEDPTLWSAHIVLEED